jgi:hypothetical protein
MAPSLVWAVEKVVVTTSQDSVGIIHNANISYNFYSHITELFKTVIDNQKLTLWEMYSSSNNNHYSMTVILI